VETDVFIVRERTVEIVAAAIIDGTRDPRTL
jgi:hypothetical protein